MSTKVWSPTLVCDIVNCSVPVLNNGYYLKQYSNARKLISTDNSEMLNTLIEARCNPGFTLSKPTERLCQANEHWTGSDPICNPITCNKLPPPFPNGTYSYRSSEMPFTYNFELIPVCDEGFYLRTNETRRCYFPDNWTGSNPSCQRIQCWNPSKFWYGSYNLSQSPYDYGSVLVPTCNTGYNIANNISRRVCKQHNEWSGPNPVCEIIKCKRPSVLNGQITYHFKDSYNYGTSIHIKCNDWYETIDRSYRRTCQADGTWGPPELQCVKILCNDTVNVNHVSIYRYPEIGVGENANVSYNSSYFYLSDGSVEIRCNENRRFTWIKQPYFGKRD